MAIITLGQAKKLLAPYAGKSGKCPDDETVRLFVMEILQRLLHSGANGNLRKWCFCTDNGCFTAPHDMDLPLKVKIDGCPDFVWSKWYEFAETNPHEFKECDPKHGLMEQVNQYFTVYDLPPGGAKIYALSYVEEDADAHFIIQGVDVNGRDVYLEHLGESVHGEYLSISKTAPKRTRTTWTKITGIQKSQTRHYVRLYWQTEAGNGLLGEYRPAETQPSFRRFKVLNLPTGTPTHITVLGRIKDPDYYHDNDVLPVTNISALRKMAQLIQAEDNDKIDIANYKRQTVDILIDNENQYRRNGEESFDFIWETSPGANWNLI